MSTSQSSACSTKCDESQSTGVELNPIRIQSIGLPANGLAVDQKYEQAGLCWSGVSLRVGEAQILDNVSGCANQGEIHFMFGASGSGKTSLLNVLAGGHRGDRCTGTVEASQPLCMIEDSDMFHGTQTVREVLHFEAALQQPGDGGDARRRAGETAEKVLGDVGLVDQAEAFCGGLCPGGYYIKSLSKGQLRRLTIASRLTRFYSCAEQRYTLLADEPLTVRPRLRCDLSWTQALDSATAVRILDIFKGLANQGHTIILTIHQPSEYIWRTFASTCSVLQNGLCVYNGGVKALLRSCHTNFGDHYLWSELAAESNMSDEPDFLLRFFSGISDDELRSRICARLNNKDATTLEVQPGLEILSSFTTQVTAVLIRSFRVTSRNVATWVFRIVLHLLIGLMVLNGFWDVAAKGTSGTLARYRLDFFSLVVLLITPVLAVSGFVLSAQLDKKDMANKLYRPAVLCLSYQVVENSICTINALCYCACTLPLFYCAGVARIMIMLWLFHISMTHTFFLLAQLIWIPDVAILICGVLVILNVLASGFIIFPTEMVAPFKQLQWISLLKYVFMGMIDIDVLQEGDSPILFDAVFDGDIWREQDCFIVLIVYTVVMHVALFGLFAWKYRS